MRSLIGKTMIVSLFVALFLFMGFDSNFGTALKVFATTVGIALWIGVGIHLAIPDE